MVNMFEFDDLSEYLLHLFSHVKADVWTNGDDEHIYDSDGKYVGRITTPENTRFVVAIRNNFLPLLMELREAKSRIAELEMMLD